MFQRRSSLIRIFNYFSIFSLVLLGPALGKSYQSNLYNTSSPDGDHIQEAEEGTQWRFSTAATTTVENTTRPYCASYCTIYGEFVARYYCRDISHFCCRGRYFTRFCCKDESKRLPALKDTRCPTPWWYHNWQFLLTLLGTVMIVMLVGACIYYCCIGFCKTNDTIQRVQRRFRPAAGEDHNLNTISDSTQQEGRSNLRNSFPFDPTNPNAFTPPAYDSLPKDPPKYSDIFDENGQANPAFLGDLAAIPGTSVASSAEATALNAPSSAEAGRASDSNATTSTSGRSTSSELSESTTRTTSTSRDSATGSQETTTSTAPPVAVHPRQSIQEGASPIRSVSINVSFPTISEVSSEAPPPYTLEDSARSTSLPSVSNRNDEPDRTQVALSVEQTTNSTNRQGSKDPSNDPSVGH